MASPQSSPKHCSINYWPFLPPPPGTPSNDLNNFTQLTSNAPFPSTPTRSLLKLSLKTRPIRPCHRYSFLTNFLDSKGLLAENRDSVSMPADPVFTLYHPPTIITTHHNLSVPNLLLLVKQSPKPSLYHNL